jgi:HAD superfamily hydrolase (TIGR01549 family)
MLYKNLIWDFDGTLFDSYPHVTEAYYKALLDFGREVDREEILKHLKVSFTNAHEQLGSSPELIKRFKEYEADMDMEPVVFAYDGIVDLIRDSHAAGVRHFVFTHRDKTSLEYLNRDGILECFTGWVTKSDRDKGIFVRKPKSDSIEYLIKTFDIDPEDCAMVGDREIDILSGKGAGTHGILFDKYRNLGETVADHRVYTIAEMRELIFS